MFGETFDMQSILKSELILKFRRDIKQLQINLFFLEMDFAH